MGRSKNRPPAHVRSRSAKRSTNNALSNLVVASSALRAQSRAMKRLACIGALALLGCGGSDGKMTSHTIDAAGITIDAPSNWKLETPMKNFYSLKGDSGFVQIRVTEMAVPKTLDEAAASCTSVLEKEALPSGAFYVLCGDEAVAGVKTKTVEVRLPIGDKAVVCQISTDKKLERYKQICKSMKTIGANQ